MNLLAFDTSTESMSLAVKRSDGLVFKHTAVGGTKTSAQLIPEIMRLLKEAKLSLNLLNAIVISQGPGSFTGVRTACSVAQGLAYGAGILILPVPTLLAIAEEARFLYESEGPSFEVWALLDARMDQMYAARYLFDHGNWEEKRSPTLMQASDLDLSESFVLAGNVFETYGAELKTMTPEGANICYLSVLPTATALLRLAPVMIQKGFCVDPSQLLPLYVRDKVAKTTLERAEEKFRV